MVSIQLAIGSVSTEITDLRGQEGVTEDKGLDGMLGYSCVVAQNLKQMSDCYLAF